MKNFKLTVCDAFIERLVNLAALEGNALFQDVYLDVLRESMNARARLRRTAAKQPAHAPVSCCVQNA